MRKGFVRFLVLVAIIITAVCFVTLSDVRYYLHPDNLHELRDLLLSFSPYTAIVFVCTYVFSGLFLTPTSPLSLLAGFLFGPWVGTGLALLGSLCGATVTFFMARILGKTYVDDLLEHKFLKVEAIDEKIEANGFFTVVLCRLIPLLPFNGLNIAFGLSKVHYRDYFLGTPLGMIPGTGILVYVGSGGDVSNPLFLVLVAIFLTSLFSYLAYLWLSKRKNKHLNIF